MGNSEAFRIQEADFRHHNAAMCALWQRNLPDLSGFAGSEKIRMSYLENPAGQGTGFLLSDSTESSYRGVICLHPRRFFRGSRAIAATNLADFSVDQELRTVGPALMLMRQAIARAKEEAELLYGLPNLRSLPVCKRVGLRARGHKVVYVKILSTQHPALNRIPRAARPLARATGTLMLSAAHQLRRPPKGWHCTSDNFDCEDIDTLWNRRPSDLLLAERSSSMLQWRFSQPGRGPWQLTIIRDANGAAQGYVVWSTVDGAVCVGDFYTPDPTTLTQPLWTTFSSWARKLNCHSLRLEFLGLPAFHDQLRKAGFQARGEGGVLMTPADAATPDFLTTFDSDC